MNFYGKNFKILFFIATSSISTLYCAEPTFTEVYDLVEKFVGTSTISFKKNVPLTATSSLMENISLLADTFSIPRQEFYKVIMRFIKENKAHSYDAVGRIKGLIDIVAETFARIKKIPMEKQRVIEFALDFDPKTGISYLNERIAFLKTELLTYLPIKTLISTFLKYNYEMNFGTKQRFCSLIIAAFILIQSSQKTRLDSEVDFIINNADAMYKLIENKQEEELADLLKTRTVSWTSRLQLFSLPVLKNLITDAIVLTSGTFSMLAGSYKGGSLREDLPYISKGVSRAATRAITSYYENPLRLSNTIITSLIGGGLLWKLTNRLDSVQAQKTAGYLIKNKKTFERLVNNYRQRNDKTAAYQQLRNFINKSYQGIFMDLLRAIPGSSYVLGS